jgi:hypothetical protein
MLVAFSVSPVGTGEAVGAAVAEAVRVVRESGLPNRTDAMFTTIEGEWDEVMAVVKAATDAGRRVRAPGQPGAEGRHPARLHRHADRQDRLGRTAPGGMSYRWLSFTTDYGTLDGFVATVKGVIAGIAPDVAIVDVTHQVPAQDVRRAAAVLAQTAPWLPPAVHLAVVDPGVGTQRRGIAVVAARGVLVGPDNGCCCRPRTRSAG